MSIRAIIFDRDNTLLHFSPAAVTAIEAQIATAAPALPMSAVNNHWLTWPGPWPRTREAEAEFWDAFWSELARQHDLPPPEAAALAQISAFYHTCFAAFPDTAPCLAQLRARKLRLAILTNFELPSVDLTLSQAGIDPNHFEVLLSSASIGLYKPDPRAFLAVADALGLHPSECAFVDDLVENVRAARALGMAAWQIDREHSGTAQDGTRIHSLYDLPDLLHETCATNFAGFGDASAQIATRKC
jgi:putative hydrolase of the HAD superfamily